MTTPQARRARRIDRVWLLIITAVMVYGLVVLGNAVSDISSTQHRINRNRVALATTACTRSNQLSHGLTLQSQYLEHLIVAGAVSTKPFDKQLRSLGFPSYRSRLRQARAQAAGLKALELQSQDCASLVESIRRAVR